MGYLTMNSGLGGNHSKGKLTLSELKKILPSVEIIRQDNFYDPNIYPDIYIIIWGRKFQFPAGYENLLANGG